MTMLAALLLLGLVLAYWTWNWFAPRPVPRARLAVDTASSVQSAQALFGGTRQNRPMTAAASDSVRLLGVAAAAGGRPGYAVVKLEGRHSLTVREGEDIAPGIRLMEVHPDHVIVTRNGLRETLSWPDRSKKP